MTDVYDMKILWCACLHVTYRNMTSEIF